MNKRRFVSNRLYPELINMAPRIPIQKTVLPRQWVYQPDIKTFFWNKTSSDIFVDRKLEFDDDFVNWCFQNNCEIEKDWVICKDDAAVTLFMLKWL